MLLGLSCSFNLPGVKGLNIRPASIEPVSRIRGEATMAEIAEKSADLATPAATLQLLPRTSSQILGPFYPLGVPWRGGTLRRVPGRAGRARGRITYLAGRS